MRSACANGRGTPKTTACLETDGSTMNPGHTLGGDEVCLREWARHPQDNSVSRDGWVHDESRAHTKGALHRGDEVCLREWVRHPQDNSVSRDGWVHDESTQSQLRAWSEPTNRVAAAPPQLRAWSQPTNRVIADPLKSATTTPRAWSQRWWLLGAWMKTPL
jgi:hypothetical protein